MSQGSAEPATGWRMQGQQAASRAGARRRPRGAVPPTAGSDGLQRRAEPHSHCVICHHRHVQGFSGAIWATNPCGRARKEGRGGWRAAAWTVAHLAHPWSVPADGCRRLWAGRLGAAGGSSPHRLVSSTRAAGRHGTAPVAGKGGGSRRIMCPFPQRRTLSPSALLCPAMPHLLGSHPAKLQEGGDSDCQQADGEDGARRTNRQRRGRRGTAHVAAFAGTGRGALVPGHGGALYGCRGACDGVAVRQAARQHEAGAVGTAWRRLRGGRLRSRLRSRASQGMHWLGSRRRVGNEARKPAPALPDPAGLRRPIGCPRCCGSGSEGFHRAFNAGSRALMLMRRLDLFPSSPLLPKQPSLN